MSNAPDPTFDPYKPQKPTSRKAPPQYVQLTTGQPTSYPGPVAQNPFPSQKPVVPLLAQYTQHTAVASPEPNAFNPYLPVSQSTQDSPFSQYTQPAAPFPPTADGTTFGIGLPGGYPPARGWVQDPEHLKRVTVPTVSNSDPIKEMRTIALIVTIQSGSSYDNLFRSVPQISSDGTIAVYDMSYGFTEKLYKKLQNPEISCDPLIQEIIDIAGSLQPQSVVFNWECCSACSDKGFASGTPVPLIAELLSRGYMVMCSDFSVKGLLHCWEEPRLGPNPFQRTSGYNATIVLKFDPQTLTSCPSTQLQRLGELCSDGTAVLHAMGGTVGFSYSEAIVKGTDKYQFSLLSWIPGSTGSLDAVGHAMLKYPSGGILLLSCGHWIELTRVNTTEEAVLRVGEASFGKAWVDNFKCEYVSVQSDPVAQQTLLNNYSTQIIQQSTLCSYSLQK